MLVYNNVLVQVGKCGFIVFTEEILNGTFHFCAVLVRIVFVSQKRRIE